MTLNTTARRISAEEDPKPQTPAAPRVARAAGIMLAAILASRVLGLLRDVVVSKYFGANEITDAYKAAFTLPDLFYYIIAGGALSSAFIPVFTEYVTKGEEEEAWKVFSIFGTAICLGLAVLIVVGELFTKPLLLLVVPGFRDNPAQLDLTVSLTRIVFPAQICFFLGGLMMSTLYVRNEFLVPALGPVVYNIFIIAGGILGAATMGAEEGIYGLCWGVLAGAFIGNVLMQAVMMRRVGVHYRPSLNVRHPGVVRVAKLMLPVLLGLSLTQLHAILSKPFGSYLPDGSITWLDNANKVMQMPMAIFAQALGVAIFPTLSAMAARGDLEGMRRSFSLGLRAIFFLTIPASALIVVLAEPIIRLLFQWGLFDADDTRATAQATAFYALGIFAYSGAAIVGRGFYALQNTLTPMLVGTAVTVVYVALNFLLMGPLHHNGLALSMSIAGILNLLALLVLYRRRAGDIHGGEILSSFLKVTLAAGIMGLVAWGAREAVDLLLHAHRVVRGVPQLTAPGALAQILASSLLGSLAYLALVRALRVPEAAFVTDMVLKKLRRR
jgi:putative peptidoglycan lipid II flippase